MNEEVRQSYDNLFLDQLNVKNNNKKFRTVSKNKFFHKNKKNKKLAVAKYDIDSLMSEKDKKCLKIKRPTSYLIVKGTAEERRKRIGL